MQRSISSLVACKFGDKSNCFVGYDINESLSINIQAHQDQVVFMHVLRTVSMTHYGCTNVINYNNM